VNDINFDINLFSEFFALCFKRVEIKLPRVCVGVGKNLKLSQPRYVIHAIFQRHNEVKSHFLLPIPHSLSPRYALETHNVEMCIDERISLIKNGFPFFRRHIINVILCFCFSHSLRVEKDFNVHILNWHLCVS
jgi:hypothetical protein